MRFSVSWALRRNEFRPSQSADSETARPSASQLRRLQYCQRHEIAEILRDLASMLPIRGRTFSGKYIEMAYLSSHQSSMRQPL
jgi:hypothetical protein